VIGLTSEKLIKCCLLISRAASKNLSAPEPKARDFAKCVGEDDSWKVSDPEPDKPCKPSFFFSRPPLVFPLLENRKNNGITE